MQNSNLSDSLFDSIQTFEASQQNLDTKTLSELYSLISDVYTSSNNEYRKEREEALKNIRGSSDWKKYTLHVFQIICFSEVNQMRMLERLTFEVSKVIESKGSFVDIQTDEFIVLVAANLYTLLNRNFSSQAYGYLARALRNLFRIGVLEKSAIQSIIEQYLISQVGNLNRQQSLSVVLIFKELLDNQSFKTPDLEVLDAYLQTSTTLSLAQFQDFPQAQANELSIATEMIDRSMEFCFNFLEKLVSCYYEEKKNLDSTKTFDQTLHWTLIIQKEAFFQPIVSLSEKVLGIDLNGNNIKLMSLGDNNVHRLLSNAKKNSIRSLNVLFQYLFAIKTFYEVQFSQYEASVFNNYVQLFSDHLKFFLTQAHAVVSLKYSNNIVFSAEQNSALTETLSILSKMVDRFEFYDLFNDNKVEILLDVIMTLFLTTKTDYDSLKEDPRDFTLAEQDMVENGESNTLKTNAAQFLVKYCEKVDGTLSWLSELLISSINCSLELNGDYSNLQQYQNSLFFNVDPLNRIETSFLGLILLTKLLIKRTDLIDILDQFFVFSFKTLLNVPSELVKCRVCLFMKEIIPYLFKKNEYHFNDALQFLFECLVNFENQAQSYQAVSALQFAIDSNSQYYRVQNFLTNMIEYFKRVIYEANEEHYFDFLITIFQDYHSVIYEQGTALVRCLLDRALQEFKCLGQERTNIIIVKCLEGVQMMVASQDIMDSQFSNFEDDLQNMFVLLDQSHRIDFEDALISIATEIARHTSMQSPLFSIVQRNLMKVLQKNDYSFDMFFDLFYFWSYNGSIWISTEEPEIFTTMIKVCLAALDAFSVTRIRLEYETFSKIATCLQIILQSFSQDDVVPMMEEILKIMDKTFEKITSDFEALSCYRFLQTYYCLIFYCTPDTVVYMRNEKLMQLLIKNVPFYFMKYYADDEMSRKVISIGLLSILFQRRSLNLSLEQMHGCFTGLIMLLGDNPVVSSFIKPTSTGQKIDEIQPEKSLFDFDFEKFSDPAITAATITLQEKEFREFIDRFELPIALKDEFISFSELYKLLKEDHPEFINSVLENLDPESTQKLKSILLTKGKLLHDATKTESRRNVTVKTKGQVNQVSPFAVSQTTNYSGGNFFNQNMNN